MNNAIVVRNVSKTFNGHTIFNNLNFEVNRGSITAIVGPNGSGKSTLFNVIAGILPSDTGDVVIQDFNRFRFSYVFQNYRESLLPWKTNLDNVSFPLQIQGVKFGERNAKAKKLLNGYGLGSLAQGYPYELSGGQQQMLALMRALIAEPELVLLDEPFSSLDYENTLRMRNILQDYYLQNKATIFIITHDIEEAGYLANKIIILSSKPTKIIKEIENQLEYPRTIETLKSENFHVFTNSVLDSFRQTVSL